MPTPAYIGNTDFRIVSVEEQAARNGPDGLTISLIGRSTALAVEFKKYVKGSVAAGYPYMYLDQKSSTDSGPVANIVLNYIGALDQTLRDGGRIDTSDSISRQSVTLTTNEDENVSFFYYAQQTTTRWMHYGSTAPLSPKFRVTVPTTVPTNQLFGPNPPNYTGKVKGSYKITGRLAQFDRPEIARGVYMVTESWDIQIEPVTTE